jgi:hypothetical protein
MTDITSRYGFHAQESARLVESSRVADSVTKFTYTFRNFFHPFVGELIAKLNRDSLAGMLDAKWQEEHLNITFFRALYDPREGDDIHVEHFPKEIDVAEGGPYANYNWELLFHVPLTIAVHLSKAQRFAEAQRWFHYVFDPTSNDESVEPPRRFWKFIAFRRDDPLQIDELLALLSRAPAELSAEERERRERVLRGYQAIFDKPFQPHAVARTRPIAYQYAVVMKYLDNLIAWGDSLFRQDTVESINEATQRYVLAANLLGPRPQAVPPGGAVRPKTFAQLQSLARDSAGGPLGNPLVELEGQFPLDLGPPPSTGTGESGGAGPLFGIGRAFYFCIPRNEKLLGYWDTVAERLFKIRHCMNIEGVVRPLALFEPPIDPGLLASAVAAGIDVGSVIDGLGRPAGPLRPLALIQKALELCAEVRALGGALLAAVEKGDAERLAQVRQRHEVQVQRMAREVRFLQWKSAQESTRSLLAARAPALERLRFYQRALGLVADPNVPDTFSDEGGELTEENFNAAYTALVEPFERPLQRQNLPALSIAGAGAPAQQSGAAGAGRLFLNTQEDADLNLHGPAARSFRIAATTSDGVAQVLALLPDFGLKVQWWGLGGDVKYGGSTLASMAHFVSSALNTNASDQESQGARASKTGSFERRADDWMLQYNLAAAELNQNGRQVLSSLIAEQVARREHLNAGRQVENAQEVDDFLRGKFTGEELYLWMQGEISRLYYEYYRFAFDTARRAERAMKQELMRPELDAQEFVKLNYWDGGRKGLLSGEALHLDVKRMELAYHENNRREFELTRHVSLRQLNPLALLALRATGTCTFTVPEWLYDRDCPGHYMRRIKSAALSVPSVVGPYTSVNCTLSLLRSSLRKSALTVGVGYARRGPEDERFVDYVGAVQSVVTSSAGNDGGLFETSLRDERFLPFEGAGAESTWQLELPAAHRAFDYATISDVILHLRYTARPGVEPGSVTRALDELFREAGQSGHALLFSLRHDFPTEWSAFVNAPAGANFTATLRKEYFPYFAQGATVSIDDLSLYAPGGTSRQSVGDTTAATAALNDPARGEEYTLTAGTSPVLTREATQAFLLVRYSFRR